MQITIEKLYQIVGNLFIENKLLLEQIQAMEKIIKQYAEMEKIEEKEPEWSQNSR